MLPGPVGAGVRSPFQLWHQHHGGTFTHSHWGEQSLPWEAARAHVRRRAAKPYPRLFGWCPQTWFMAPSASSLWSWNRSWALGLFPLPREDETPAKPSGLCPSCFGHKEVPAAEPSQSKLLNYLLVRGNLEKCRLKSTTNQSIFSSREAGV